MLKHFTIANLVLVLSFVVQAHAAGVFPEGPNPDMTPGVLCANSNTYRYDEHILYCERNVNSSTKNQIIKDYDLRLGFSISKMPRGDFKIDHFIPLSIGGANDIGNLWPQHKSIYQYSDPLESQVSDLMVKGRIKQAEAIQVIRDCKLHLERCEELSSYLKTLL